MKKLRCAAIIPFLPPEFLSNAGFARESGLADEAFLQILFFIAVLAEPFLPLPPLEDDVNVAGDQGRDLLALRGLDAVVLVLVVPEVQREHVGRGRPPSDGGEGPGLQDLLRLLIQSQDGVLGDSKQSGNQLVPPLLFLLRT